MAFIGRIMRARALRSAAPPEPAFEPQTSGLTAQQLAAGGKALAMLRMDDRHNQLTQADVLCFLRAAGLNPTPDALDMRLRVMKLQDAQRFMWGQLCHIWHGLLREVADEEDILVRAFEFFDKDGNGEISVAELRTTMAELGGLLSDEEILEFVGLMDANNDGAIGYEEFIRLLRSQGPLAAPELESAAPTQPASPGGGAPPRGSFGDATDAAKLAVAAVDTQGGGIERGCSGQEVGGLSFGQGGQQQSGELEGSLSAADMPADAATPMHAAREQWQAQRQHQEQTLPAASFALRPERSGASGFGSGGAGSASGGGDSIRLPGAPHNARDCEQLQQGPSTAQPRGPSSLAT